MLHLWAELGDNEHVYVRRSGNTLYVQVHASGETVESAVARSMVQATTYDVVSTEVRALMQRAKNLHAKNSKHR